MAVRAWDSHTKATIWTAGFPRSVYPPRPANGVDVFDVVAGALVVDVREVYTTTRGW